MNIMLVQKNRLKYCKKCNLSKIMNLIQDITIHLKQPMNIHLFIIESTETIYHLN